MSSELELTQSTESSVPDRLEAHAAPLLPLRARDLQALIDLFQQDEIASIEADVLSNLQRRHPELCWEEFDELLR